MKCLHICNDFLGSQVHKNLYTNLDKLGVEQVIFVPYRRSQDKNKNLIKFEQPQSQILFSETLKRYHRIFFLSKVKFLIKSLEGQVHFKDLDVVYATTLFSDGAIALYLHNKYNIPYIVAVRSTDVDVFMRARPDLRNLCKEILIKAQKIVFISDSLKTKFERKIHRDILKVISSKIEVIYNGVSPFWLANINPPKKHLKNEVRLIYVGSLIRRKNVVRIIKAVLALSNNYSIELNIIGGKGIDLPKVKRYSEQFPNIIKYLGPISELQQLLILMRNNDIFIMPSYRETFGLVYIEALSQGLPIVYAQNEGVDGMLETIGIAVNPYSVRAISNGIETMILEYESFNINRINFNNFDWSNIAKRYLHIFENLKKSKENG